MPFPDRESLVEMVGSKRSRDIRKILGITEVAEYYVITLNDT
jgi:hypothetical protein